MFFEKRDFTDDEDHAHLRIELVDRTVRLDAHSSTLIRKTLSQPTSVYRGMMSLFRAEVVDHRIRNADWPGLEFLIRCLNKPL